MPLLKGRHLCVLPQEKAESPRQQINQLKICQLLSARLLVVFPVGLNESDQPAIINLPGPLHSSSSVTTDEYPYIEVNIPTPTPEEQDCATLPLGRKLNSPTVSAPKTPWKPRITLLVEVNDLIEWGMTDNYDQELEHSVMVEVPATEADAYPPMKMEMPVLPLDTSSQASTAETEASIESKPIGTSLEAVAHSSCSNIPIMDLPELQSDAHLAVNSMFTVRKSSDLDIQHAIRDFEASLHQCEAEEATTNEEAKITHLRRDLRAKAKCARAIMKAKYKYQMAIQEARAERCTELEESEVTYFESLSENVAVKSLQCAMLHREHMEHMWELEASTLQAENKKLPGFPVSTSGHPMSSPTITQGRSTFFFLPFTGTIFVNPSIHFMHPSASGGRAATLHYSSQTRTQMVHSPKEVTFLNGCTGRHVYR